MKAYSTLVRKFPGSELVPHALFELGKLRGESGDDAGAIQAWVQALERHPDPQVVQSAIARTRKRIARRLREEWVQPGAFQRPEPRRERRPERRLKPPAERRSRPRGNTATDPGALREALCDAGPRVVNPRPSLEESPVRPH